MKVYMKKYIKSTQNCTEEKRQPFKRWIHQYLKYFYQIMEFRKLSMVFKETNHISDEMIGMLSSSATDRWFKPRSVHTKDCHIGIFYASA